MQKTTQQVQATAPTHASPQPHRVQRSALRSQVSPTDRRTWGTQQALPVDRYAGNQATLRRLSRTTPRVQCKLQIGAVNDPLEAEADRVADQVMRMSDPGVAPAKLVQRKCAECEEEEKGKLSRKESAAAAALDRSAAPPIVHDVLSSSGQPLDSDTRAFFEPRFGSSLSDVRVHTGSAAADSAKAVRARAYTVGQDIVLGAEQGAPRSADGRRLLAHELTHVLQQRGDRHPAEAAMSPGIQGGQPQPTPVSASPAMLSRDAETTVEVTAPTGPNVCTLDQHRTIAPAVIQSVTWLNQTIQRLDAYIVNNADPAQAAVRNALDRHFHSTAGDTATQVRGRLDAIRTNITGSTAFRVECHGNDDRTCGSAAAYVLGSSLLAFCPGFFNGTGLWHSEAIIHEMAHALVGGAHITDLGYQSDRIYALLTTQQALTNAESFGLFVQELGTSRVVASTAPVDPTTDCPADWQPLIRTAIALAQRWNREAQTATGYRKPEYLTQTEALRQRYLGSTAIPALDAAQAVYDKLAGELDSDIGFECELDAKSGRCGTGAATYWYAIFSHFHLCPVWKSLPTDEARTTYMLAGLYGFLGGVDDSRLWNLAYLARDLTGDKYKTPAPGP